MGNDDSQPHPGFAIFINTLFEGEVPLYRDGEGKPYFYATREEAECEIVDDLMTRLQEYMEGERDFEDAITVEEYILPVERLADGSVVTEDGGRFH